MRKYVVVLAGLLFALGIMTTGCGKGNSKSPYHASYGDVVEVPASQTINSTGGGGKVMLPVYVLDGSNPVNDIAVTAWIMPSGGASDYSIVLGTGTNLGDFVGGGVDSWNDDGMPIYKTNDHGRADVEIRIPTGFAGVIDIIFDIGVNEAETKITIKPIGGTCFDGTDNNGDKLIDALDPACGNNPDGDEI